MGKWKTKPARAPRLGGVVASVEEHEAAARADVRAVIGEDREIRRTPDWQVPISAIVMELVLPLRSVLEDQNDPEALAMLGNLAMMAWNTSRVLRGADTTASATILSEWNRMREVVPEMTPLADGMLSHARTLHPSDDRLIIRSDVIMKNGQPFIHATSTPGAAALDQARAQR